MRTSGGLQASFERIAAIWRDARHARPSERAGRIDGRSLVVLTGAGISAASGIPTFRGPEGYWTVGSREYRPHEIATWAFFRAHPEAVWAWYLYRRGVCLAAEPNRAHHALVEMERNLGDRFLLVTQNVDGLHLRAGNSRARTYEIHGNLDWMRCADACDRSPARVGVPVELDAWERGRELDRPMRERLHCAACGGWMRPHVLWFDEVYDEPRYRCESSLHAVEDAFVLLVVGTSGATSLPWAMGQYAVHRGVPVADVNPDANPFAELAAQHGLCWRAEATEILPQLAALLVDAPGEGT